jgi:hypothetical protein
LGYTTRPSFEIEVDDVFRGSGSLTLTSYGDHAVLGQLAHTRHDLVPGRAGCLLQEAIARAGVPELGIVLINEGAGDFHIEAASPRRAHNFAKEVPQANRRASAVRSSGTPNLKIGAISS